MLDTTFNPTFEHRQDKFKICPASKDGARDLTNLAVIASDGLCKSAWHALRAGEESTLDVGIRRAAQTSGSFSYRNADIALQQRKIIAAIISYPSQPEALPPVLSDYPPLFRPFARLEHEAGPSWYINFLATYPGARNQGAATALLEEVQLRAKSTGFEYLSLIVGDTNPARHLYLNFGFHDMADADVERNEHDINYSKWVLMKKKTS